MSVRCGICTLMLAADTVLDMIDILISSILCGSAKGKCFVCVDDDSNIPMRI